MCGQYTFVLIPYLQLAMLCLAPALPVGWSRELHWTAMNRRRGIVRWDDNDIPHEP